MTRVASTLSRCLARTATTFALLLGLAALPACGSCACCEDEVDATLAANNDFAKLSPEEQMKAMTEFGSLAPEHALLQKLAGNWDLAIKMRFGPNEAWQEMPGTIEAESVLGGRFVLQRYRSSMMGQPFEGIGMLGYDKLKQRFTTSWMDVSSTCVASSEGQAEGNTIHYVGRISDLITPRGRRFRTVETIVDDDHWTSDMFDTIDGAEVQVMGIAATRRR